MLADLLIDHGVGVADEQVIRIRKLDEDYFEET
jgi:restriction endonuclease Mrr